jgi:hypothetical protein
MNHPSNELNLDRDPQRAAPGFGVLVEFAFDMSWRSG